MTSMTRWYARTATALVAVSLIGASAAPFAAAQNAPYQYPAPQKRVVQPKKTPAKPAVTAQPQPRQLPPRVPFTAAEDAIAGIPGMPDARFWADSIADFKAALPPQPGPWITFSSGGADGAFGAGLLNGLTESGKRPDYAMVAGVSTGALMAPFVFAGPKYDASLRAYTKITAADVFEIGNTGESFLDSWPLKDLIAKQITPELLADIAAGHRAGRRLFVVTTNLDAQRSVVWNMGAIATHAADKNGGDAALKLFRTILLASSAIPGGFPPVLIDVEADGKQFAEMHVDGGVGGQFFVAPPALMAATSDYKLPATALYVVINTGLQPEFHVVDRSTPSVLTNTVGAAVQVDTRLMMDRAYLVAKRSGVPFNVATVPADFNAPSHGPFDPDYMSALFQVGEQMGRSATPFANEPPAYPGRPSERPLDSDKTGANR
jgi:hypothetical protein